MLDDFENHLDKIKVAIKKTNDKVVEYVEYLEKSGQNFSDLAEIIS